MWFPDPDTARRIEESGLDPLSYLDMLVEDGEDDADGEGSGSPGQNAEPKKPFGNLELKEAFCWGWCPRAQSQCWANIADASVTKGWRNSDIRRLDYDLKVNVDACYFFPCQGTFEDLDTGFRWRAAFVADHDMWKLELNGSQTNVLPEDAKAFFASEYFRKFAKRCGDLIDRARKIYENTVAPHVSEGELLLVDAVKLERILHDTGISRFMDNLRECKYELA